MSKEKMETIKKLQEAANSSSRLKIIKNINKGESIKELTDRLGIPQPTMSQAINRFKTYGLIVFLKKKGNSEVYDKIPMLKQIGSLDRCVKLKIEEREEELRKSKILERKPIIPSDFPFIDSKTESDAERMVEPYIILYLFENSLRNFINKILSEKYGEDWWKKIVTKKEIYKKVDDRKKLEGIHKWHVPRGAHEIFYTDLEDLAYLLRKEEKIFKNFLGLKIWDTYITEIIKLSRNIVDHHNPLPQREINRLKQIFEDWKRQMK